jgi:hypothetical protein
LDEKSSREHCRSQDTLFEIVGGPMRATVPIPDVEVDETAERQDEKADTK